MLTQSYMLSCKKSLPLFRVLGIAMALTFLQCADNRAQRADGFAMEILDLYFAQEATWAEAIAAQDSLAAISAMDSMQVLMDEFYKQAELYPWPAKDSIYFGEIALVIETLYQQTSVTYPAIFQLAFLPEKEFTFREEEKLHALLQQTDSLTNHKMQNLEALRQEFFSTQTTSRQ